MFSINWRSYTSRAIRKGADCVSDGKIGGGGGISDCVGIGSGSGGGSIVQIGGSGAPSDNALFENKNRRFEPDLSVGTKIPRLCGLSPVEEGDRAPK